MDMHSPKGDDAESRLPVSPGGHPPAPRRPLLGAALWLLAAGLLQATSGCAQVLGIEELSGDGGGGAGGGSGGSGGGSGGSGGGLQQGEAIVTGQAGPGVLALDTQYVFWGAADGTVWRAKLDGAEPKLIADQQGTIRGITSNGDQVFWTANDSVRRAFLSDLVFKDQAFGQDEPWGIAADSSYVFWVNRAGATANGGAVMRAPIGGGVEPALYAAQERPVAIALSPTEVFWTNTKEEGSADGTVWRGSTSGTGSSFVAGSQTMPVSVTLGKDLVWANRGVGKGQIMAIGFTSGSPTVLADGLPEPLVVVADPFQQRIYVLCADGSIQWIPEAGGQPTTVATTDAPGGLALDQQAIYWTTSTSIMRLLKK